MKKMKDIFIVLRSLFKRIGFEAGRVKRLLDESLISWGYFVDHNPFEPHCNAHPNNFIILDLNHTENVGKNLLSPVDFDMTYNFDTFVS